MLGVAKYRVAGVLGGVMGALIVGCSSSPTGGGGGGGGGTANLIMQLEWSTAGNMDVGATTPGGIISANFSGNDPLCTHSGDDLGNGAGLHTERMTCTPAAPGPYTVVVENGSANPITYTLRVQVNGANRPGYPVTATLPANAIIGSGNEANHMFSL